MSDASVAPVFRPSEPSAERPARTAPGLPVAASLLVALAGAIVLFAFAVGLVDMALRQMGEQGIVELDEERKAAMVSNLMVVLVGDHGASPVVNAGSLYQ